MEHHLSSRKFAIGQVVRVRSDLDYRGGQSGKVVELLADDRYGVRFAEPGTHNGTIIGDMAEAELQTAAEFIADALVDGQRWRFGTETAATLGIRYKNEIEGVDDGISFEDVMRRMGGRLDHEQRAEFPDIVVWVFGDGSAIVATDGGWDMRATGCQWHCWAGAGCECED